MSIRSPRAGATHRREDPLQIRVSTRGEVAASEVYVGETFVGSLDGRGNITVPPEAWSAAGEAVSVVVTVASADGGTAQDQVTVTLR